MIPHREERSYVIDVSLVAEFSEDYAGEEDGFVWHEHFQTQLRPKLVRAIAEVLGSDPRFSMSAAPRGKAPERALEVELRFKP